MFSTVRYSSLPQHDELEDIEENTMASDLSDSQMQMEYGMPEGSFRSAFTYANYNDLDRMGYEAPKRFGNSNTKKYSRFTYTNQWDTDDLEIRPMNSVEMTLYAITVFIVLITLPISLLFTLKFVSHSEKLVVLRLGRVQKPRGSGATIVFPCIDSVHKLNTTIAAFNVPPLQIITIDRGCVELGAVVYHKVRDPIAAVCGVLDRNNSTRTLANTMLYRYISKKRISELTNSQDRKMIAGELKNDLCSFTAQFGVEITDVELSEMKVLKEGENLGMSALSNVANSETGQQIWQMISPLLEDFTKDAVAAQKLEETEHRPPTDPDMPGCSTAASNDDKESSSEAIDMDALVSVVNLAIDEVLVTTIGKVFQIDCTGMKSLYVDVKHAPGGCAVGTHSNPDVVFSTTNEIFHKIITKKTSPLNCYMDGSLKVQGSIQDALSFKHIAERVSALL